MLLSFLFFFLISSTFAVCNSFINPPPDGSSQPTVTWQVDSIQELSWSTDWTDLALFILASDVNASIEAPPSYNLTLATGNLTSPCKFQIGTNLDLSYEYFFEMYSYATGQSFYSNYFKIAAASNPTTVILSNTVTVGAAPVTVTQSIQTTIAPVTVTQATPPPSTAAPVTVSEKPQSTLAPVIVTRAPHSISGPATTSEIPTSTLISVVPPTKAGPPTSSTKALMGTSSVISSSASASPSDLSADSSPVTSVSTSTKLGVGIGIGIGIPLVLIAGVAAVTLLSRCQRKAASGQVDGGYGIYRV